MKKQPIKLAQSLSLNKETITKLNDEQLSNLEGGQEAGIFTITCNKTKVEDEAAASCIACSCNQGE